MKTATPVVRVQDMGQAGESPADLLLELEDLAAMTAGKKPTNRLSRISERIAERIVARYPDTPPTEEDRKKWREEGKERRKHEGIKPRKQAKSIVADSPLKTLQKWAKRERYLGNGRQYEVEQIGPDQFQLLDKHGNPVQLIHTVPLPLSNIPTPRGGWESVFSFSQMLRYLQGGIPSGKSPEDLLYNLLLNTYRMTGRSMGTARSIADKFGFEESEVRIILSELDSEEG